MIECNGNCLYLMRTDSSPGIFSIFPCLIHFVIISPIQKQTANILVWNSNSIAFRSQVEVRRPSITWFRAMPQRHSQGSSLESPAVFMFFLPSIDPRFTITYRTRSYCSDIVALFPHNHTPAIIAATIQLPSSRTYQPSFCGVQRERTNGEIGVTFSENQHLLFERWCMNPARSTLDILPLQKRCYHHDQRPSINDTMKSHISIILAFTATSLGQVDYSQYVNPFIGSEGPIPGTGYGGGDISIGGARPFGVSKVGIDTTAANWSTAVLNGGWSPGGDVTAISMLGFFLSVLEER